MLNVKNYLLMASVLIPLLALSGCEPQGQAMSEDGDAPASAEANPLKGEEGSYIIGHRLGADMADGFGDVVDVDALLVGIRDGLEGNALQVSEEVANRQLQALQREAMEARAAQANDAKRASEEFLAANAEREGVTTTASGLQYEVITAAEGPKPGPTSSVTTHYHGTLPDGSVFDSSVDRGQPATFRLNQVIPGWTEALQLMSAGSKYRLFIPADLAYGERGSGNKIGPGQALIFEVELISIN